ncbi:serine aminopeptidase domain-containing protein, partial [Pseudoduganella buxea]
MKPLAAARPPLPFFLDGGADARFCVFHSPSHSPSPDDACRGAIVYLHPFAEEMNKSRRMAALGAAALAADGYAVLQIDLHGCGDSAGDFGDATWESWLDDVARARRWLQRELGDRLTEVPALWGLRLGALLALDAARRAPEPPSALLLWQPVTSGAVLLTQFLR